MWADEAQHAVRFQSINDALQNQLVSLFIYILTSLLALFFFLTKSIFKLFFFVSDFYC